MAKVNLTDNYVKALSTDDKRLEIFDEKISGLVIRVSKAGRKTWLFRYRSRSRNTRRFTLGTYPALGLVDARSRALQLLAQTQTGLDPAQEKRKAKEKEHLQTIKTFCDLAEAYLLACERGEWKPKKKQKRKRTLDGERGVYCRYIKNAIGKKPLDEITRSVVKKLLRDMMARGIKAQTIQAQAFIRQAFAYAIAEFEGDIVTYNPATGFGVIGTTTPRKRVLNDDEMRTFWHGILNPPLLPPDKKGRVFPVLLTRSMGIAMQLCILLLMRSGEIAGMAVSELDLENAVWLIPGERMKGGQPLLVPLPAKAVQLIKEALSLRPDPNSPFVFPSPRWKQREPKPVLQSSIYHAMADIIAATRMDPATPHDLRRTGSTVMTSERLNISPFIRSKVLGHRSDTGGGASVSMVHYDANEYIAEKRKALTAWQNLVLKIVNRPLGKAIANGALPKDRIAA